MNIRGSTMDIHKQDSIVDFFTKQNIKIILNDDGNEKIFMSSCWFQKID